MKVIMAGEKNSRNGSEVDDNMIIRTNGVLS